MGTLLLLCSKRTYVLCDQLAGFKGRGANTWKSSRSLAAKSKCGEMASSMGYIGKNPQLVSGPRGASGLRDNGHTHRREGGGRGGGSRPANTGVDVWRDGDLEGWQGLPETREHQPGSQRRELAESSYLSPL